MALQSGQLLDLSPNKALFLVSGHHLLKMTDLREELDRLEMSQYLEVLVAEGFDTWVTILDITESDLCVAATLSIQEEVSLF